MSFTYTYVFSMKSMVAIAKHSFYCACKELEMRFDQLHGCKGYRIEPEDRYEGGLAFRDWPGKTKSQYKSLRIRKIRPLGDYGKIDPDFDFETWNFSSDILCPAESEFEIMVKSFHGAPLWTIDELNAFCNSFSKFGLVRTNNLPHESKLESFEDCGLADILD